MKPAVKVIEGYVHSGRVGVLVELALETSFTAGMAQFKQLTRDLALQVASASVESVEALMAQPFVKEPSVSVGQLVAEPYCSCPVSRAAARQTLQVSRATNL